MAAIASAANLAVALVLATAGCGPRDPGSASGGMDGSGTETGDTGSGESACGSSRVVVGPVALRSNEDAIRLAGCTEVEGDLLIDPCRLCLDETSSSCEQCTDETAVTSLSGLDALERVTGRVVIGWDPDPVGNEGRSGYRSLGSLSELAGLREIGGDLHLGYAPSIDEAAFPVLERIGGELLISDSFDVDPSFPALREVEEISLAGRAHTRFDFPALIRASGIGMWETQVPLLAVPRLTELHRFDIHRDTELADLSPLLRLAPDGVSISSLPRLVSLDLAGGSPGTSIFASDCDALERVSLPADVDALTSVYLELNDSLSVVDFPGLVDIVGDGLRLSNNARLESLSGLPAVSHVGGSIAISHNPQLCSSEVESFVAGVDADDGIWTIEGNGDC